MNEKPSGKMSPKTPIPFAFLTSTEPPTLEFQCEVCDERMKKELFSRNNRMQYKLTCADGEAWVQL